MCVCARVCCVYIRKNDDVFAYNYYYIIHNKRHVIGVDIIFYIFVKLEAKQIANLLKLKKKQIFRDVFGLTCFSFFFYVIRNMFVVYVIYACMMHSVGTYFNILHTYIYFSWQIPTTVAIVMPRS